MKEKVKKWYRLRSDLFNRLPRSRKLFLFISSGLPGALLGAFAAQLESGLGWESPLFKLLAIIGGAFAAVAYLVFHLEKEARNLISGDQQLRDQDENGDEG